MDQRSSSATGSMKAPQRRQSLSSSTDWWRRGAGRASGTRARGREQAEVGWVGDHKEMDQGRARKTMGPPHPHPPKSQPLVMSTPLPASQHQGTCFAPWERSDCPSACTHPCIKQLLSTHYIPSSGPSIEESVVNTASVLSLQSDGGGRSSGM